MRARRQSLVAALFVICAFGACGRGGPEADRASSGPTTSGPTTTAAGISVSPDGGEPKPCPAPLDAVNAPAGTGTDPAAGPRPADAGSVRGSLVLGSGPAAGKTVRLVSCGTPGVSFDVTTGADGTYRFDPVPAGTYLVRFGIGCKDPFALSSLVVTAGKTKELGSYKLTC